jgi:hypothetical protein
MGEKYPRGAEGLLERRKNVNITYVLRRNEKVSRLRMDIQSPIQQSSRAVLALIKQCPQCVGACGTLNCRKMTY